MKKMLVLAVVLIGAGVTSRAGVSFGISVHNGHGHFSGGYESYTPAPPSPPPCGNIYVAQPGYGSHGQGHGYDHSKREHEAFHHDLKHERRAVDKDFKAIREQADREFRHQRAHGVPKRVVQEQRKALDAAIKGARQDSSAYLRAQHSIGHQYLHQ
jgi:hypothetical protein